MFFKIRADPFSSTKRATLEKFCYEKLSSDPNIEFILFEDRGQTNIFYTPQAIDEYNELIDKLRQYRDSLGNEYSREDGLTFLEDNFNFKKGGLNTKLMDQIIKTFDSSL